MFILLSAAESSPTAATADTICTADKSNSRIYDRWGKSNFHTITLTVSGMLAAVAYCNLLALRVDQVFDEMLSATNVIITDLDMIEIELPRQRKPPKRLTGDAPAHQYTTVSDYYRPVFFSLVDTAVRQLKERFSDSPGLNKYGHWEMFCSQALLMKTSWLLTAR